MCKECASSVGLSTRQLSAPHPRDPVVPITGFLMEGDVCTKEFSVYFIPVGACITSDSLPSRPSSGITLSSVSGIARCVTTDLLTCQVRNIFFPLVKTRVVSDCGNHQNKFEVNF